MFDWRVSQQRRGSTYGHARHHAPSANVEVGVVAGVAPGASESSECAEAQGGVHGFGVRHREEDSRRRNTKEHRRLPIPRMMMVRRHARARAQRSCRTAAGDVTRSEG